MIVSHSRHVAGPLLIASTNAGKLREFTEMLKEVGLPLTSLSAFPDVPAVEETGFSFTANARKKACAYAQATRCWTLADDSGLVVDALDGAPGVQSARWAEVNKAGRGDAANNALLLRQLADVPDERRTARFVCVLALSDPSGHVVRATTGTVEGRILREKRGKGGFGYDPLFLIDSLGRTTAEMTAAEKHTISHRGQALRKMLDRIRKPAMPGRPRGWHLRPAKA